MKILSLIAIPCFTLALVAACSSSDKTASPSPSPSTTRATSTATPTALTTTPATATASPAAAATTATATNVCATNPKPGTPDTVKVDSPAAGTTITSPVTVTGQILAFEATFRIRIYDATGNVLADEQAMSAQGQVLSPFSKALTFSVARQTPACLWVFELSAAGGSPANVAQVAVTLQP